MTQKMLSANEEFELILFDNQFAILLNSIMKFFKICANFVLIGCCFILIFCFCFL